MSSGKTSPFDKRIAYISLLLLIPSLLISCAGCVVVFSFTGERDSKSKVLGKVKESGCGAGGGGSINSVEGLQPD